MTDIVAIPLLRGPVPLTHSLLPVFLHEGDCAVDATCGNGHDTLQLAKLVGETGHVWGFDIQQQAIAATVSRLAQSVMMERVTLLQTGHEELSIIVKTPIQVALFNLGYLPGGERTIITRPETTISALKQSLELLASGGVIMITIYQGHSGSQEEQAAVESWAASLEIGSYHCWRMSQANVRPDAPYLMMIQKAF